MFIINALTVHIIIFLCALVKSIYNHNNSAYLVLHPHKASSMTSSKFWVI